VTNIMRICNSIYSTNLRIIKIKNIIQGEHKTTLRFQNDTENKCDVLTTSHVHQSTEKLPKFCTHLTQTRSVLHESEGHCRDDNQVVPNCGQCAPSDGSCGSCDSLPQLWQRLRKQILG
jgi:hypothetical protein